MGLFDLLKQSSLPVSQLTEAEMAALKFQQMKAQMDEMSRMRQMGDVYTQGTPSDVDFLRGYNPQANTMQNIPPYAGGMSASNARPPMDLNSLLKMLGY